MVLAALMLAAKAMSSPSSSVDFSVRMLLTVVSVNSVPVLAALIGSGKVSVMSVPASVSVSPAESHERSYGADSEAGTTVPLFEFSSGDR